MNTNDKVYLVTSLEYKSVRRLPGNITRMRVCLFDGVKRHFQQYFSYIVTVSFIGGGNWRTRRKPPTCRKSLTNFIT